MGALSVGDQVLDESGAPCNVTFVTDVMLGRACFDVRFSDGASIIADAEHQWVTEDRSARKGGKSGSVVTTLEILESLKRGKENNHAIRVCGASLPDSILPIAPYTLGAWLGDGDSAGAVITSADPEILANIALDGYSIGSGKPDERSKAVRYSLGTKATRRNSLGRMIANGSLQSDLAAAGLLKNKHIPGAYLRSSKSQRVSLLCGLMDTDGSISVNGNCEITVTNRILSADILELCLSLGLKAVYAESRAKISGRDCGPRFRITFTPSFPVFRLSRKLARHRFDREQSERNNRRYIVSVTAVESVPVKCIQVDSVSSLFLASRWFIPTHNTRCGAEWIRGEVETGRAKRIALVGRTAADVRDVIVGGESGILAVSPPWFKPDYIPSKRKLIWPNGAIATTYTADEPDQLRGPQHDAAWADELAAWRYADAWDQLMFGLRLGKDPRAVVTTTPRPTPIIRSLIAQKDTHLTTGSTYENQANLAERFIQKIVAKFEGTRLGRQELYAEMLDDAPGALWKRDLIEDLRVPFDAKLPDMRRIIVAVDPSVSADAENAATGIVVIGLGEDKHGYVLEDASIVQPTPDEWARKVDEMYKKYRTDLVIAEVNQGGDLVESNVRTVNPNINYRAVRAMRGKYIRAEPIAGLTEQRKIHHVGTFAELEDELCQWEPISGKSPNRLDAYVWGFTEIMDDMVTPTSGYRPQVHAGGSFETNSIGL